MPYKIIAKTLTGDVATTAMIIDIVTSDKDERLRDTLNTALDANLSTRIDALQIRAFASKEAVTYNGWEAIAYLTFTGNRYFDFTNEPDVRKFIFDGQE